MAQERFGRNPEGLTQTWDRNAVQKWLGVSNPSASAICGDGPLRGRQEDSGLLKSHLGQIAVWRNPDGGVERPVKRNRLSSPPVADGSASGCSCRQHCGSRVPACTGSVLDSGARYCEYLLRSASICSPCFSTPNALMCFHSKAIQVDRHDGSGCFNGTCSVEARVVLDARFRSPPRAGNSL